MGKASRSAATAISPAGLGGQGRWNALGRWRGLRAWRGKPSVCAARPPARHEKAAAGLRSATVFQRPVALRACRSGRDTQPVRQMSPPVALCPLVDEQRKPYARIDLFSAFGPNCDIELALLSGCIKPEPPFRIAGP